METTVIFSYCSDIMSSLGVFSYSGSLNACDVVRWLDGGFTVKWPWFVDLVVQWQSCAGKVELRYKCRIASHVVLEHMPMY